MLECVASSYHLIFLHKIQMGGKKIKLNGLNLWNYYVFASISFEKCHWNVHTRRTTEHGTLECKTERNKMEKQKGFHIHEKAPNKMSKIGWQPQAKLKAIFWKLDKVFVERN